MAMLLVVWAHLGIWFSSAHDLPFKPVQVWRQLIVQPFALHQDAGHLGVLLFFLISGWVITYSFRRNTPLRFVIKRVLRLAPGMLLGLFAMWIFSRLNAWLGLPGLLGHEGDGLLDYVYSFFLTDYFADRPVVLSVTWTLVIEVMFYALIFFMMCLPSWRQAYKTLAAILLTMFVIIVWPWAFPIFLVFVLYALLGHICFLIYEQSVSKAEGAALLFLCFLGFCSLYQYATPYRNFPGLEKVIASDLWALVIFFLGMVMVKHAGKLAGFIADISYSVYLLHLPIGSFLLNLLVFRYELPFKAAFPCTLLVVVLAACVVYYGIERPIYAHAEVAVQYVQRRLFGWGSKK